MIDQQQIILQTHYKIIGKGRHVNIPLKSGNTSGKGRSLIFCSKRSFLLRKRMTEVSRNHLLFRMELNNLRASSIRFWREEDGNVFKNLVMRTHKSYASYWNQNLMIIYTIHCKVTLYISEFRTHKGFLKMVNFEFEAQT